MKQTLVVFGTALALIFALGCVGDDWFEDPGNPSAVDEDKDGVPKEEDCDDTDNSVYPAYKNNPGAPELANCVDDDCDGKVDEGTSNEDKDNDGYCPSTGDLGDCEGNKNRNPGVAEDGGNGTGKPNNIDDDCDGQVDEGLPLSDMDKDGFTIKDGDCNDNDKYINPGAIEVEGLHCKKATDCPNGKCYGGICRCLTKADCSSGKTCKKAGDCTIAGESCKGGKCTSTYTCNKAQDGLSNPELKVCRDNADNDCDKKTDELPEKCDTVAKLNQQDPYHYAKAMELCDTDHKCGIESKCPGALKCVNGKCSRVLSATWNSKADPKARAIAGIFAKSTRFKPKAGEAFAILSTGKAVYDPKTTCPQSGTNLGYGNTYTDPDPKSSDKTANDYIHLSLEILVPTNAQSFDFDFHFFSTEYPEYVGTKFNDTFWVQMQSKKFNGNISFDKNGIPIRINNAFFSICDPDPYKPATAKMCNPATPSSWLTGTGYAKDCGYSGSQANGGSTNWLHTTAPVTPGETIKLTFSIFDKGDHILDSAVLIDNFRWKLTPAKNPITGPD